MEVLETEIVVNLIDVCLYNNAISKSSYVRKSRPPYTVKLCELVYYLMLFAWLTCSRHWWFTYITASMSCAPLITWLPSQLRPLSHSQYLPIWTRSHNIETTQGLPTMDFKSVLGVAHISLHGTPGFSNTDHYRFNLITLLLPQLHNIGQETSYTKAIPSCTTLNVQHYKFFQMVQAKVWWQVLVSTLIKYQAA
jgi:hypothetical protein